jgi:hypothetical protein
MIFSPEDAKHLRFESILNAFQGILFRYIRGQTLSMKAFGSLKMREIFDYVAVTDQVPFQVV